MAYIGNTPAEKYSAFQKQDFTTSATTSYTLDNPVANANELALFINFVRQEPTTAYTASGTSLTLTSATSASDDMYCVYLGKAVQTVNPPNSSVGTSQLVDNSVTETKLASGVNTIQMADQWRLSVSRTTDGDITNNLERVDNSTFGYVGTGMTESSGIFTFPLTGIYLVQVQAGLLAYADTQMGVETRFDVGSGYVKVAQIDNGVSTGNSRSTGFSSSFINVTNTSTCKAKFTIFGFSNTSQVLLGASDYNRTSFTFIRLGDT